MANPYEQFVQDPERARRPRDERTPDDGAPVRPPRSFASNQPNESDAARLIAMMDSAPKSVEELRAREAAKEEESLLPSERRARQGTQVSATVTGPSGVMDYVTDTLKGVVGGTLDAANATLALPADLGEATGLVSTETAETLRKAAFLPEISAQQTTVGEITRQITKFGVGFIGAGKIMAPIKAFKYLKNSGKLGSLAAGAVQGAAGDFLVSDPHEARLADLIESVPALENPITEFLASNKGDNHAVGRFKAAAEGVVPGVLLDALAMGVKGLWHARKLRAAGDPEAAAEALAKASDQVDKSLQTASSTPVDQHGAPMIDGAPDVPAAGMTRLYRHQKAGATDGRWTGGTEEEVGIYATGGPLHYVDVPTSEVEALRVSNKPKHMPEEHVKITGDPEREFYLRDADVARLQEHYGAPGTKHDLMTPERLATGSMPATPRVNLKEEDLARIRTAMKSHAAHLVEGADVDFPLGEHVFNIGKMDSSHEVLQTLDDFAVILRDQRKAIGGGEVRSLEVTQQLASMMGGKAETTYAAISRLAKDSNMMGEYLVAGKAMMQSVAGRVADLATKIDSGLLGKQAEVELVRHADVLADLMEKLGSIQTGAARATSAGRIRTTASVTAENVEELLDSVGGSDAIKKVAARIRMARDPQGVIAALKVGTGEKLANVHNFVWVNGILGGMKTHVVNFVSNSINTLVRPAQRILGGAMSGNVEQVKQGTYQYMALRHTIFDSLEMAGRAFKQNANILDPNNGSIEQTALKTGKVADYMGWQDKPFAGFMNFLGQAAGIPGRLLNSSDEFFKQINYRSHVIAEAWSEGMERGLSGGQLDEYVKTSMDHAFTKVREVMGDGTSKFSQGAGTDKAALRAAQEATFTQSLKVDTYMGSKSVSQWLAEGANTHPVIRATVLPFVKVPANLMRTFIDSGPIALSTKRFKDAIQAGGEQQAMALGKLTTGSAMWIGAGFLASEGRITGMGPQDKELQRELRQSGWQPYSFVTENADGTKSYTSFQKLDPFGMFFGLAADIAHIKGKYDQGVVDDLATTATVALAGNLASKSYLRGLVDIMGLLGSGYSKEEAAQKYLNYRVASYVPAWTGMLNPDTEMKEVRSILDGILARIPGMSENVEAKRDNFGQKFVAPQGYPYSAVNPFTMTTTKGDVVREELSRLAQTASEARFPLPQEKPWGEGIDLTQIKNTKGQSAYDRWLELHSEYKIGGKTLHDSLKELMGTDTYKKSAERMGDGSALYRGSLAVDMINKKMTMYRNLTLHQLQKEMPEIRQMSIELQTGQKRAKVLGPAAVPAPQFLPR